MTNTEATDEPTGWYAFVRFSEEPHDLEGYVFADRDQARAWCERAEQRAGVVAAGMLPEFVREQARAFGQQQRDPAARPQ